MRKKLECGLSAEKLAGSLWALPVLLAFLSTSAVAENWPAWRGASGRGVSNEKNLPLTWSASKNIRWKFPLPEPGNSTPIVWKNHVFLTQALDGGKRRAVIALDRQTGEKLWQRELPCDVKETTHRQNPPCSSSPITDGKAVYAYLGSSGVVAYDFTGKQIWHRDLGPVLHRWGNGGSPVLYKDLLIVFHGPGEPTFLTALDKRSGKTVWKTPERAINSPIFGSWSTPVLLRVGERDELIFPLPGDRIGGQGWFNGYDPATGKQLWRCTGLGNEVYAMPIVSADGDIVVGVSGHKGPAIAVRPGGRGDVTSSHLLWRSEKKNAQRIGSGVIHQGRLFLAGAGGLLECLEAKTGKLIWQKRLGGNLWGSILLAGDKLYVTNIEGDTFIVQAGPKFRQLAKNSVAEPTYAAMSASQGDLFLRTYKNLYCIDGGD